MKAILLSHSKLKSAPLSLSDPIHFPDLHAPRIPKDNSLGQNRVEFWYEAHVSPVNGVRASSLGYPISAQQLCRSLASSGDTSAVVSSTWTSYLLWILCLTQILRLLGQAHWASLIPTPPIVRSFMVWSKWSRFRWPSPVELPRHTKESCFSIHGLSYFVTLERIPYCSSISNGMRMEVFLCIAYDSHMYQLPRHRLFPHWFLPSSLRSPPPLALNHREPYQHYVFEHAYACHHRRWALFGQLCRHFQFYRKWFLYQLIFLYLRSYFSSCICATETAFSRFRFT